MAQVNLGHVVGPGVPTGGAANQVLVKNGATNFDTSWKDASQLPAIGDEETAREAADAALADGLAIIANGDTHAAVAAGQAVFVRSHSTLAPGLYWASSAIGTNAALSTSNLTADNQGGLNKLKGDIDSLNSKIAEYQSGNWVPDFMNRDTPSSVYAAWISIGNIMVVTAQWTNSHVSGASAIDANSLPNPTGKTRNYGLHGTWRSYETDKAGEVGQYQPSDTMRFSLGGVGVELPNEKISFTAVCLLH